MFRTGQDLPQEMLPHPLTNFKIQQIHQNQSKLNGVYWRNNLPKIKDGAPVINFDEYESIGTYWIALHVNGDKVTYFDSFIVEHFPKEIINTVIKILWQIFIEYMHTIQ